MSTNRTDTPQVQAQVMPDDERDRLFAELELRTRQLAESEARFRDVIERNADAIIVVDMDGLVRFGNSRAAQLFNKPIETLYGAPFGFPMVAGETTELDLPNNGNSRVLEMRVVESQWQGQPACIATLRDVTERKHAEQNERFLIREQAARAAAETAARRFRFLADSSAALSSSLEYRTTLSELARLCVREIADWAVVYCTDKDQQLRRYDVAHRDKSKQKAVQQFRDAPLALQPSNPVEIAMQTGQPIVARHLTDQQIVQLLPDAHNRSLVRALGITSYMMIPITARGRSLGAIALVSSTQDRLFDEQDLVLAENLAARAGLAIDNARLYEEAREANQTKTELLAVISHDLRTPLNSIIGYTQLLEMGIPEPLTDGSKERVQRIRQSAGHLLYLIDELLAFARVEGKHEDLNRTDVDAGRIVREVGELMEPLALQKKLQLTVSVVDHAVNLTTDADKLRQVLVNLVGNAVKYTKSGSIALRLIDATDEVRVQVQDTGVGIDPEDLPHIFEPFWQVDRTRRSIDGGTGLGLSVVQRVVELLGGKVAVESEVGVGSTFTVVLPKR
jgi:signal transduction histidine kinase